MAELTAIDSSPLNVLSSIQKDEKPLTEEEKEDKRKFTEQTTFLQNKAKLALAHAVDSRRRYDYEWMVRDLFRRGYQFSRYQPTTQTVILASRQSAKIPINITLAQMRSIRNQVTSFRPKFECLPKGTAPESETQARYAGKMLDYLFDHLNLKKKIKETVIQGLMFSVGGPWQIVYDEEAKEVKTWLIDPFDFYFDPLAEELEDAEYCIKAVRRPLYEVIYNQEFNQIARKEVTGGEARLAVSEYKQFMLQALKFVTQFNREEAPSVILFEGYFRVRDSETGKAHLRKVIWTDQNSIPLLYEDLDTNEYDFVIYHADLNPKEIYGEGWMKHVMPLNRALNSLESSVFDYNYKVAKGRIVVDRDSGVRAIHNQHGEIISKNRGAEVRPLDMPPLPVATQNQIERIERYIEDVGGAHDASLGRVPAGVKSGVGVAELKQADATSQDDLVDNLEDFLTLVGQKMLKKVAQNYTAPQVVYDLGYREQEAKYFAVVGPNYQEKKNKVPGHENQVKIGPDWFDIAKLSEDNNVRVTIGSWLGYTKEMMQEKTLKLLQLGAIDQKTFLRLWEFGNIDSIIEQTRIEQLFKSKLNQQQGGPPQVDPSVENDMMVLEGKPVMPDMHDDHWVHVAIHQQALGKGRDDLVGKHIQAHMVYMEQTPTMDQQSQQQEQPQQPVNPGDISRQQVIQQQQQGSAQGALPPTQQQPQMGNQPPQGLQ